MKETTVKELQEYLEKCNQKAPIYIHHNISSREQRVYSELDLGCITSEGGSEENCSIVSIAIGEEDFGEAKE